MFLFSLPDSFPRLVFCAATIILADAPGDVACAASLYDNGLHMGMGVDATVSNPGGSATGLTWWGTMNGGLYEDSPPPVSTPVSSPHAVSITAVSASTAASSTSPSSSSAASNTTGPLHIPAKRPTAYESADSGSVIRHSHPAQPWNYGESPQFDHQYPSTPPYYNLDGSRDSRKLGFWPPVTASPPEYKYSPAGPVSAVSAGPDHQGFSTQSWCSYPPYPTGRHDPHPHAHQPVAYSLQDDRRAAAAAMVAAAEGGFTHDGYGLRNYSDPVPSTPYPPPGKLKRKRLECSMQPGYLLPRDPFSLHPSPSLYLSPSHPFVEKQQKNTLIG